jgi:hypothetical protein
MPPDAAKDAQIAARSAVTARDAGLRRISSVTRRLVIGAVALSGALALIAANTFHGRTIATRSSSSSATQSTTSSQGDQTTSPPQQTSSDGLSAPSQAPTPTPVAPVVVSGGS